MGYLRGDDCRDWLEDVHRLAEMTPHAAAEMIEQRLAGTRSAVLNQCMKHFEALNQLTGLPGKAVGSNFWRRRVMSS